jgi:hypothetical protein
MTDAGRYEAIERKTGIVRAGRDCREDQMGGLWSIIRIGTF